MSSSGVLIAAVVCVSCFLASAQLTYSSGWGVKRALTYSEGWGVKRSGEPETCSSIYLRNFDRIQGLLHENHASFKSCVAAAEDAEVNDLHKQKPNPPAP